MKECTSYALDVVEWDIGRRAVLTPSKEARIEIAYGMRVRSHEGCDPNSPRTEVGPSGEVHDIVQEIVHEGTYGPWVMVARRKNGTKT